MSAIVVVSTFGALNGVILAGPRAYLAMARDGLFTSWAAAIHPNGFTRRIARCCCKARGRSCSCPRAPIAHSLRASFTPSGSSSRSWPWGSCASAGGRPTRRPIASGDIPRVPIVFIICSAYIVINQLVTDPAEARTGLLFVLAGLPVYFLWLRRPHRPLPGRNRLNMLIDVHNHFYPPEYLDALKAGDSAVKLTIDAEGNPCLHYPGDYNVAVRGHRDIDYRQAELEQRRRRHTDHHVHHAGHARRAAGTRRSVRAPGERRIREDRARSAARASRRWRRCRSTIPRRPSPSSTRVVTQLGFPGAMLFSNVNGVALADARYRTAVRRGRIGWARSFTSIRPIRSASRR